MPMSSSSDNVSTIDSFLEVLMGLSRAKTSLQDPICRTWAFLFAAQILLLLAVDSVLVEAFVVVDW